MQATRRDFSAVLASVQPELDRLDGLYPERRSALLPMLHAFQDVEGFVSPEAMNECARILGLPPSVAESTASFYTLFFRRPVGRYMLQVCRGMPCVINGAAEIHEYFRERLGIGHLETTDDGMFSYEEVECLAACDRATCMQVNLEFAYSLTPEGIDDMLAQMRAATYPVAPLPQTERPERTWHIEQNPVRRSPGAVGVVDPNSPGGIGDASGARALDRLGADPLPISIRPSNERLVRDGAELAEYRDRQSESH